MGPRHHLSFYAWKTAWLASELLVFMVPSPLVWFLDAKQRLLDRINKFLWVPGITCRFVHINSVFSIRITSLHGSQLSCVVFGCNRATFGQEKQVSMSPRHNLSLCACKIAWLASELLASMCPSPHLLFLHAKQLILDQNIKSLRAPALICGFCMPNSEFWPRITSLYASQTSPAILSTHNSVLSTRINRLYWFQLSPVV